MGNISLWSMNFVFACKYSCHIPCIVCSGVYLGWFLAWRGNGMETCPPVMAILFEFLVFPYNMPFPSILFSVSQGLPFSLIPTVLWELLYNTLTYMQWLCTLWSGSFPKELMEFKQFLLCWWHGMNRTSILSFPCNAALLNGSQGLSYSPILCFMGISKVVLPVSKFIPMQVLSV